MPITPSNPAPFANPMATPPSGGYGNLSIADLLAVNNTAVIDFGREPVFATIKAYYAETNAVLTEQLEMFTEKTTDRARGVGGPATITAKYTDEWGVDDSQKISGAAQLGFPLRKSQVVRGWTNQWMRKHTPADLANQAIGASQADVTKVQAAIRRAVFYPLNTVFVDNLVDYMSVYVKAFANADGFPIPATPSGVLINAATHNHYAGTTNVWPSVPDLDALINNVTEHTSGGKLYLFVPMSLGNYMYANRTAIYTDFSPLTYPNVIYGANLTVGDGVFNVDNPNNRRIGIYKGAEVWVKPWVPDLVTFSFVAGTQKPIAWRVPADLGGDNGDFRPVFDDEEFPLACEILEREFGFGVQNRVGGALLSYAGPDTNYVTPAVPL